MRGRGSQGHDHGGIMPEDLSPYNLTGIATADKESIEIAAGDITPTKQFIILEAQTSTTDNLDGIVTSSILAPGDADGAIIYLMADAGDTITIRHNQNAAATKNILTPTGADIVISGNTIVPCQYNIALDTNGAWVVGSLITHTHADAGEGGTVAHTDLTSIGNTTHAQIDYHMSAYNGSIIQPFKFNVTSTGGVITGTIDKNPSGNMTQRFSDGYSTLTSGTTITITAAGGDTAPVKRFIYILQTGKSVLVEGSAWPATEHSKIAEVIVQTAATVEAEGPLVNRNWNDMAMGLTSMGHHLHTTERLRGEHSNWFSGGAVTWTGSGGATLDFAVSAAKVYQLHLQAVDAFNTADPDDVLVVNHATPYFETPNIESLVVDSVPNSLNNRFYNLVIWGTVSSAGDAAHVFINLPSGSYAKLADATADVSGYDNFTLPSDFRGYSYLIERTTIKNQASSTFTIHQQKDLRGTIPSTAAGSGTAAITTEFADGSFRVFDDGDPSKEIAFEASSISGSTTRTITVPNKDLTLIDSADAISAVEGEATLDLTGAIASKDAQRTGLLG